MRKALLLIVLLAVTACNEGSDNGSKPAKPEHQVAVPTTSAAPVATIPVASDGTFFNHVKLELGDKWKVVKDDQSRIFTNESRATLVLKECPWEFPVACIPAVIVVNRMQTDPAKNMAPGPDANAPNRQSCYSDKWHEDARFGPVQLSEKLSINGLDVTHTVVKQCSGTGELHTWQPPSTSKGAVLVYTSFTNGDNAIKHLPVVKALVATMAL